MEDLLEYFAQFVILEERVLERIMGKLELCSFPKKHIILQKGEVENYISFIESGSIRFYVPDIDLEKTFAFIFEQDLVCAYDSFLSREPALYCAETMEETILYRIAYSDLQKVYDEIPESNVLGRKLSEVIYLKKAKRELSFLLDSPETRYEKIFSERPNLLQRVPLKYIASYIGVTPQALSRIRKRIS
ncbi:Crp/Fnr family transcriptional regulator [Marinilongibacter aquaticus]|uniref:Crp/Fnr family transcriptional regulator n=1 Tax=Marinilongibacter aquaticus TaxID=2975157 RepID=UPI0021BDA0C9|nr:Crp/Fnr family transcriptional regulator [Marinilongibacter aquaticus]UBM60113.1 Crp/Fnr family transcriptional regulator [Marinilongibacter aquaticus]